MSNRYNYKKENQRRDQRRSHSHSRSRNKDRQTNVQMARGYQSYKLKCQQRQKHKNTRSYHFQPNMKSQKQNRFDYKKSLSKSSSKSIPRLEQNNSPTRYSRKKYQKDRSKHINSSYIQNKNYKTQENYEKKDNRKQRWSCKKYWNNREKSGKNYYEQRKYLERETAKQIPNPVNCLENNNQCNSLDQHNLQVNDVKKQQIYVTFQNQKNQNSSMGIQYQQTGLQDTQKDIRKLKYTKKGSQQYKQIIMQDENAPQIQIQFINKIYKPSKTYYKNKYFYFSKRSASPFPTKRYEQPQQYLLSYVRKQKIPKFSQILAESKKNLQITPLVSNFLMRDAYRHMKRLDAETLDPNLISCITKDLQQMFEKQRQEIFKNGIIILEDRQNARITLPSCATDQQLSFRAQLNSFTVSIMNLNYLIRQLHLIA